MTNNNYNTDKKLRDMENQLAPDLTQLENHWQQMKSTLANPSSSVTPGKGFLNNPFRLLLLLSVTVFTCFIIYKFDRPSKNQSNNNSPSSSSTPSLLMDTVPLSKKATTAYEKKDSSTSLVPRKKMAMNKKTDSATIALEAVNAAHPKSPTADTFSVYSGNKKVGTLIAKKPTAPKDSVILRPIKKSIPAKDTLRLILDSVNINTNASHNKNVNKKKSKNINGNNSKNNNQSIDSTKIATVPDSEDFPFRQ